VREFLSGERGQGLGDVGVIPDKTLVHATRVYEALELHLVARGKRMRRTLDVLLVHQKLPVADDMLQKLDCLLQRVALGGL